MKTSFLGRNQLLALLALLTVMALQPAQAASEPAAASTPAPIHLAWDRVGSPLRMSV